jgi:hypothetical protein
MRHDEDMSQHQPCRSPLHPESQFILQQHRAILLLGEVMIVLKGGETSRDHPISKKHGRIEPLNQALVSMRQSPLPPAPTHHVSARNHTLRATPNRSHGQCHLNDGEVRRQGEAALNRSVHFRLVSYNKPLCFARHILIRSRPRDARRSPSFFDFTGMTLEAEDAGLDQNQQSSGGVSQLGLPASHSAGPASKFSNTEET